MHDEDSDEDNSNYYEIQGLHYHDKFDDYRLSEMIQYVMKRKFDIKVLKNR